MAHTIVPQKTYIIVFFCLIGLTILTTGVAFIDLGPLNTVVALAIAFSKMLLVVLFFMGVKYSTGLTKVIVVASLFWLALLMSLTMTDYRSRTWTATPEAWSTTAPPTHP